MGSRYLNKGEKLLAKQKIKGSEEVKRESLKPLFQQKKNRKFLILPFSPYVWFYQTGLKHFDKDKIQQKKDGIINKFDEKISSTDKKKKIARLSRRKNKKLAKKDKALLEGNVLMRWGEPLAVYDTALTKKTKEQMILYLNSKGHFNAAVNYREKKFLKRVKVIYNVLEGPAHRIVKLTLTTSDSKVKKILSDTSNRKIKLREKYDQSKLEEERERINNILKDNGYYDFSRQYISMNVDTAWGEQEVAIETVISQPANRSTHKVFKIDSVLFTTDADIKNVNFERLYRNYRNTTYRFYEEKYSKKILSRRLFIHQDSVYSRTQTFDTQRQLANLDIFKFININYDTTGGRFIANVFVSPLKKYQSTSEVGFTVSQGLPGPFVNLSFKNRNVFKGLEILEINLGGSIEGVPAATDNDRGLNSREANAGLSFTFPQFLIPFDKNLNDRLGYLNPKTRINSGVTLTDRPEYDRTILNSSITYIWQNRRNTLFNFTLGDISFISSTLDNDFENLLKDLEKAGNNLINSFKPSFVSSASLTATYNFNRYGLSQENTSFLRLFLEGGGTFGNLVMREILSDTVEFYRYVKFNSDFRRHYRISNHDIIAYRINIGVAVPYGDNRVLPYEKYFFAGGSNSIRAWVPRRLGPGSYAAFDTLANEIVFDDSFEQSGEILLEASIEVRRNLFGFINGAIFIDAGNVWTIREEATRPGSQFKIDSFLGQIAIGSGVGLRFDFSFLVLRLDAGVKIYDPARPSGTRFIWDDGFKFGAFANTETVVYNLGVGYPF